MLGPTIDHAAIFGWDFPAKTPWSMRQGHQTYRSSQLDRLWGKGLTEVGSLTTQSAGYIARYIMDKKNGQKGDLEYGISFDHETGEVLREPRNPPYTTMSTRPGIGHGWISKYMAETYPDDHVIINGRPARPPRYYDTQYEKRDPSGYLALKDQRLTQGNHFKADNTPRRLVDKEIHLTSRTSNLKRELQ